MPKSFLDRKIKAKSLLLGYKGSKFHWRLSTNLGTHTFQKRNLGWDRDVLRLTSICKTLTAKSLELFQRVYLRAKFTMATKFLNEFDILNGGLDFL